MAYQENTVIIQQETMLMFLPDMDRFLTTTEHNFFSSIETNTGGSQMKNMHLTKKYLMIYFAAFYGYKGKV